MKNVQFLSAEIIFDGEITNDDLEQGFGAITLTCDDREYKLDVIHSDYSDWLEELDTTNVSCTLDGEIDRDVFTECNFDLKEEDLMSCNLKATLFIGDFSNELISATLFVKLGDMTKAINLELDL